MGGEKRNSFALSTLALFAINLLAAAAVGGGGELWLASRDGRKEGEATIIIIHPTVYSGLGVGNLPGWLAG